MRLANVDDEELDPIAEAAMKRFERPSLGAKGRSGIASEDQRHRLDPAEGRKPHTSGAAELRELEVRRLLPDRGCERLAIEDEPHELAAPVVRKARDPLLHAVEVSRRELALKLLEEIHGSLLSPPRAGRNQTAGVWVGDGVALDTGVGVDTFPGNFRLSPPQAASAKRATRAATVTIRACIVAG
jgi:hypothetical protein